MKGGNVDPLAHQVAAFKAAEQARSEAMRALLATPEVWRRQAAMAALGALKLLCLALLFAVIGKQLRFDSLQAGLVGAVMALAVLPLWPGLFCKNLFRQLANEAFDAELASQIQALTQRVEAATAQARTFARETE